MEWGWCPSNATDITLMSNNITELNDAIEALRTNLHDGTGTNNAMKWGLALLDPTANGTLRSMVSADFADRPAAYGDQETLKFIILMTDGQITEQVRPSDPFAPINAVEELGRQGGARSTTVSRATAENQFDAMCDAARANNVVVFTIAYLAPSGAQTQMRDCAYDPDTHFYNIDDLDVSYAFRDIATTINKIKLIR
ncbi:MAG: VWA domain-containing protein, partial [Pseudomonadota bacterium]